jgi:hypothetical protein
VNDVSHIRDLDVLSTLVIATQLKYQGTYTAAQFLLRHVAHNLCYPESGSRESRRQRAS